MRVILDTNILHSEGLNSPYMEILSRLSLDKIVNVFVPDLVRREFVSKCYLEAEESLTSSLSGLKRVQRKMSRDRESYPMIDRCKENVELLLERVEREFNEDFNDWENRLGVVRIGFPSERIDVVFDDYFSGEGAFEKPKSRKDIPDAMIKESICQFVSDVGESVFIVGDNNFRKCMGEVKGVKVYSSLKDFFGAKPLRQHVSDTQICIYLEGRKFSSFVKSAIHDGGFLIDDIFIESDDVLGRDLIGERIFSLYVGGVDEGSVESLKLEKVFMLSERNFVAGIRFSARAGVFYVTDYAEYLEIVRSGRPVSLESMNGDGICELYEDFEAEFDGTIELHLSHEMTVDAINAAVSDPESAAGGIEFGVDLHSAKIVGSLT